MMLSGGIRMTWCDSMLPQDHRKPQLHRYELAAQTAAAEATRRPAFRHRVGVRSLAREPAAPSGHGFGKPIVKSLGFSNFGATSHRGGASKPLDAAQQRPMIVGLGKRTVFANRSGGLDRSV